MQKEYRKHCGCGVIKGGGDGGKLCMLFQIMKIVSKQVYNRTHQGSNCKIFQLLVSGIVLQIRDITNNVYIQFDNGLRLQLCSQLFIYVPRCSKLSYLDPIKGKMKQSQAGAQTKICTQLDYTVRDQLVVQTTRPYWLGWIYTSITGDQTLFVMSIRYQYDHTSEWSFCETGFSINQAVNAAIAGVNTAHNHNEYTRIIHIAMYCHIINAGYLKTR